jgi:hypothetical protein
MIRAETFPALHFGPSTKEPLKPRRHPPGVPPRRAAGGGGRRRWSGSSGSCSQRGATLCVWGCVHFGAFFGLLLRGPRGADDSPTESRPATRPDPQTINQSSINIPRGAWSTETWYKIRSVTVEKGVESEGDRTLSVLLRRPVTDGL